MFPSFIQIPQVIFKKQIVKNKLEHQIRREIEIMCHLQHPHILQLYTYFHDHKRIYLVLEYAFLGQMYTELRRLGRFSEARSATVSSTFSYKIPSTYTSCVMRLCTATG